ncbi:Putative glycosyltransferase EpsD [Sedimentisphaera cyanobacteriorum]|uniref:Glycosyltransferase EpsD n=1 Tax=Sedimentisphaera cyanobacteriorum TaxID=1940790 RepID=A0A1Q2HNP3_9BACT|nr:glycosyltransferase family 4 protein [Sedimentisphaera cyanobacteriorum]AQQ08951.1 Putative glycosyltransferase EpsD [Sedimentisphaera cyanobacteriorum]
MKILYVNHKCGFFGGVESFVFKSVKSLTEAGWECWGLFEKQQEFESSFGKAFKDCVFANSGRLEESLDSLKNDGVKIAFVHKIFSPQLLEEVSKRFKTIVLFHDHDYYCLRKHKYFPVTRRNCHKPAGLYCLLCSGMIEKNPESPLKVSFLNVKRFCSMFRRLKRSSRFMVLSDYMRDNLSANGFDTSRITKLQPIIAPSKTPSSGKSEKFKILYIGQLIKGKGVDLLIKSLKYLSPGWECKIAGRGNDSENLKMLAASEGLADKVEFSGWCSSPEELYESCDVVAVPSRWQEPYGLVGVEAGAHRKPVVGFDVGGIGEWLKDNVNGFLVREGDVIGFACALEKLKDNTELRRKLGMEGRRIVKENYTPEKFESAMRKICLELAENAL